MRLAAWLIISSVIIQIISGSPLHRRTGRKEHVVHYHRNSSTGRHQRHLHMPHEDHAHNTPHAHDRPNSHGMSHGHHDSHGHGANVSPNAHSHSGHNHQRPRQTIQRNPSTGRRVAYKVPNNGRLNDPPKETVHNHTEHQGAHHDHGLDFDLASLKIDKDLFKSPVQPELKFTKKTPTKIETTTPSPGRWKMKNTLQVSDTRSFDTIFRQTVSRSKLPVKLKNVPTKTRKGVSPAKRNQQNVILYEDHGSKSISKRGIGRLGSSQPIRSSPRRNSNGFIENTLTVRVWNESRPGKSMKPGSTGPVDRNKVTRSTQKVLPVTASPRFTQGRLGRIITKQHISSVNYPTTSAPPIPPAAMRIAYTMKNKPTTSKPNVKPTDMVQLQGIHVMFSQAQQKKNNSVPTIHLTAAIDGQQAPSQTGTRGKGPSLDNLQSVIDKIVGTAIIKDGHLYLIVYPFGESKSVDLRFPQNNSVNIDSIRKLSPAPSRTLLPTNKPIPIPGMGSGNVRKATSTPSPPLTALSTSPKTIITTMPVSSMEMNHGHHHHHHDMGGSMQMPGDKPTAITNNKTAKEPLEPVPRFSSPWKALNLSSIFPHPDNTSLTDDDDKDVKVVPFVAQAADPFDKIKMILAALANNTDNATNSSKSKDGKIDPSTDASFNFEVKIKGDILTNTQDKKETTTPNENTSDERTTEYVTKVDTTKTVPKSTLATTERQTKYNIESQTAQPSRLSTNDDFTQSPKTSTTISTSVATTDISKWLKMADTSGSENYVKRIETSNTVRMSGNFDRTGVKESDGGNNPSGNMRSFQFGVTDSTISSMDSGFNSHTVRQLHESENLMMTQSRLELGGRTRLTTESPITRAFTRMSSFSQQYEQATMPPRQDHQHVLTMIDQEMSDKFTVVPRNKIISDKGLPDPVLSKTISSDTIIGSNVVNTIKTEKNVAPERVQQAIVAPPLGQSVAKDSAPKTEKNFGRRQFPSNQLDRGQTEQIISLADVLNDIRKIQLHNMQRFNIHNNNYNTMLLSNTDRTPSIRSHVLPDRTVFNDYPRIPTNHGQAFLNRPTARPMTRPSQDSWQRHANSQQNAMRDAIDAMLVLTVDDVMADHTNLHGALVLSQASDPSSGSSSSTK